ncbi:MAG: MFS transporter [Ilumatobacteraceae bacterium]
MARAARTIRRLPATLLGGLLAVRFIDEGFGFLPSGAIEQIRADLDIGYTAMSLVLAAPYAGSLPALWLTARSDRTGRRSIVLVGTALMALSLIGFAVATLTAVAVAAAILWGFGGSLMVHGAELEFALVGDDAPAGELKRRLRVCNLWGTVGDVLGPLLLGAILAVGWSWRVSFWTGAAVTLAYLLWLVRYEFSPARAEPEDDDAPAWRDPTAWRLGAFAFLLMPFDETWLAFLIAWLQVDGGWTGSAAAVAGVVAVLGAALGFGPVAARVANRSDRALLVAVASVLAVAGAVVAGVPPVLAVAAGFVVNAATAVGWVTLQHAALTLRPGAEGRVMSLIVAIEHTTVVLPVALGAAADRFGLAWVFGSYAGLGIVAAAVATTIGGGRRPA